MSDKPKLNQPPCRRDKACYIAADVEEKREQPLPPQKPASKPAKSDK